MNSLAAGSAYEPAWAAAPRTRWETMRGHLEALMEMLSVIERTESVELKFFNEPSNRLHVVASRDELDAVFRRKARRSRPVSRRRGRSSVTASSLAAAQPPARGATPLLATLAHALRADRFTADALLLVFVDGEPTDAVKGRWARPLETLLASRPARVYVTFVMCTDDAAVLDLDQRGASAQAARRTGIRR